MVSSPLSPDWRCFQWTVEPNFPRIDRLDHGSATRQEPKTIYVINIMSNMATFARIELPRFDDPVKNQKSDSVVTAAKQTVLQFVIPAKFRAAGREPGSSKALNCLKRLDSGSRPAAPGCP